MQQYDLVIIGGGMIGQTLALALKDSDLKLALIEGQRDHGPLTDAPELRVSALSLASQQILTRLGCWQDIQKQRCCPYQHMQVWDKDSFGKINFDSQSVQQDHLGHIVENKRVQQSLWQQLETQANVTIITPAKVTKLAFGAREAFINLEDGTMLSATLVVGADGVNSFVRQQAGFPLTFWDYEHSAIVATIKTDLPHQHTARQVFTPTGPLAFLPLWKDELCSIVWSQQQPVAEELLQLNDEEFAKRIQVAFDGRLGHCELVSQRQSFPLKMRYARQWLKDRVVIIGDAAHSIHPLAGQGANLGLQDAAALAEALLELSTQGKDIGLQKHLRPFERWRKAEAMKMIATMEGFKRLFAGQHPLKKLLRGAGLGLADRAGVGKQSLVRQAIGLDGELPKLAQP